MTEVNWERIAKAIFDADTDNVILGWSRTQSWVRDRYIRMAKAASKALGEEPIKQTAAFR